MTTTKENSRYSIISASVVIVSENFSPATFTPNLLADNEIVGKDWKVAGGASGLEAAGYIYENGIQFRMNKTNLTILQQFVDEPREVKDRYLVQDLADKYLERFPYAPYKELGLNCLIYADFEEKDSNQWIISQFASHLSNLPIVSIVPKLILTVNETIVCNMTLEPALYVTKTRSVTDNSVSEVLDKQLIVLGADINVHHQGPLDAEAQRKAIGEWPERQRFVLDSLKTIIGEL